MCPALQLSGNVSPAWIDTSMIMQTVATSCVGEEKSFFYLLLLAIFIYLLHVSTSLIAKRRVLSLNNLLCVLHLYTAQTLHDAIEQADEPALVRTSRGDATSVGMEPVLSEEIDADLLPVPGRSINFRLRINSPVVA